MIDAYVLARTIHILSSGVLFGSGAAIAFFMLMGWRSGSVGDFYFAARFTVLADWLFTSSAVIIQPASGLALAHLTGLPLDTPWLLAAYGLYLFIGACWLPVVWIQIQVRKDLAGAGLVSSRVRRLIRVWFLLGWPAFTALIAIFWLMIAKPDF